MLVPDRPEVATVSQVSGLLLARVKGLIGSVESASSPSAVAIVPIDTIVRVMRLRGTTTFPLFALFIERFHPRDTIAGAAKKFGLSAREIEVVRALLRGDGYATIASDLSIAACTVQAHIGHIATKTSSRNRKEIVATLLGQR